MTQEVESMPTYLMGVRTVTMRAFTRDEMAALVGGLP